jgi:tetratricopeptide (TPR) repeat protein
MDKLQLIAEIKRLVGKADIEHALQRLVEELEKAGSSLANDAIQAQSLFQKTQKDEKQGLVSFENARLNYNQVTDQILDLLETLKKEEVSEIQRKPAKRLLPWILGGVLILGAVIAALVFSNKQEELPPVADPSCPAFEDTMAFKILVLPFRPLRQGEVPSDDIHWQIKGKLAELNDQAGINAGIEFYKIDVIKDKGRYPLTTKEAERIARDCNAQLIIWGTTENEAMGKNIVLTKYKFLNIDLKKLLITGDTEVDTLTSLSSIFTEGLLTEGIFANMQLLFGVIANEMGKPEEAIAQLENIQPGDSAAHVLVNMVLSDSHLATNHPEKALENVNKVLETHPAYPLALNNRAVLNFEMGNTTEALNDINTMIELKPDTAKLVEAFMARSAIHLKIQAIDKAEQDLEKASELKPQYDKNIQQLRTAIFDEKKVLLNIKREAERKIQSNPEDTKALEDKAGADKALGNKQEALSAAKAAAANDSKDPRVHSILLEEAVRTNDTNSFKKLTKKAEQVGISRKELIQNAPVLQERFKTTIRQ